MQASNPSSWTAQRAFVRRRRRYPTTRQPLSLAICPTTEPTAPVAAATTSVSSALRLADIEQSDEGGEARHAEHARARARASCMPAGSLTRSAAVRYRVLLPAARGEHPIARAKVRMARASTRATVCADHDVADRDRRRVGGRVAHASAHVRIERQPQRYAATPRPREAAPSGDALQAKAVRSAAAAADGQPTRCGGSVHRAFSWAQPRVSVPTSAPTPAVTPMASALQTGHAQAPR